MTPLAIDRMGSVRTFDADGRLRVETTPISKANICSYFGREIPNAAKLGLKTEKTYRMLRDPEELKKGASTFNGIPVLDDHPTSPARVTAENPQKNTVVGSAMNSTAFNAPYLENALVIWDGALIDKITSGQQRELSCGYDYTPDMTPGTYKGQPYDGRMTNIRGNHIALVEKGRAGPDVLVADSLKGAPNMAKEPEKKTTGCKTTSPDNALKSLLGDRCDIKTLDAIKQIFAPTHDEQDATIDERVQREVERRLKAAQDEAKELDDAKNDVRPLVGDVHGLDSAKAVYRYALSNQGMATDSLADVNVAGLRALAKSRVDATYPQQTPRPLASDSASHRYVAPTKL